MNQLTLKEVEVQKLNVQPGDTLVVTVRGECFEKEAHLEGLNQAFKQAFKDKQVKILMLKMDEDHDVKLSTIKTAAPSYCADCSCGKKPIG